MMQQEPIVRPSRPPLRDEVLAMFEARYKAGEQPPSIEELCVSLGHVKSTIFQHMQMLVRERKLTRRPYTVRGYDLPRERKRDLAADAFSEWWRDRGRMRPSGHIPYAIAQAAWMESRGFGDD